MTAFQVEDLPMESQMLTDALDTAQKRVESYFYDIRKWVPEGRGGERTVTWLTGGGVLGRRGFSSMLAMAGQGRSCRDARGQTWTLAVAESSATAIICTSWSCPCD